MQWIINVIILLSCTGAAQAADLTVNLSGTSSQQGTLRVVLYDSPQAFPEGKESLAVKTIQANVDPLLVRFKGLDPGQYALIAFHDQNNNGILDRDFAGMPTEVYGFSNNVRGTVRFPTFAQAAIEITNKNKSIEIELEK